MSTQKLLETKDAKKEYASSVLTVLSDHENGEKAEEESKEHTDKDEEEISQITLAVIRHETMKNTTEAVISTLSWVNAAIVEATMINTFYIGDATDLANAWFLFCVSLFISLLLIALPFCCKTIDMEQITAAREVDEKNPHHLSNQRPFISRVEYLLQSSVALVVAMTLRDAANLLFKVKLLRQQQIDTAAYILYAIVCTVLGVWITIQLSNIDERVLRNILVREETTIKHLVLRHRYIAFALQTIALVLAFSWRQAIDGFILAMYGGDKLTTAHVWSYCVVMTLSICFAVSLSDHFFCLYPRETATQSLFLQSKTVQHVNTLVYDNCKFVLAFAWYDAIRLTVYYNATKSIAFNVLVLYWLLAFALVFISIYCTRRFAKEDLATNIDAIGIKRWLVKTRTYASVRRAIKHAPHIHRVYDDDDDDDINGSAIGNDGNGKAEHLAHAQPGNEIATHSRSQERSVTFTRYEVPRICQSFGIKIMTLTTNCWSTTGAIFVSNAVGYTILAIYFDVDSYNDIAMQYKRNETAIWLQWMVVIGTMLITAFLMLCMRRMINSYHKNRMLLTQSFAHWLFGS